MALSMAAALLAFFLEADTVVRGGCEIDRRQKMDLYLVELSAYRTGVVYLTQRIEKENVPTTGQSIPRCKRCDF